MDLLKRRLEVDKLEDGDYQCKIYDCKLSIAGDKAELNITAEVLTTKQTVTTNVENENGKND